MKILENKTIEFEWNLQLEKYNLIELIIFLPLYSGLEHRKMELSFQMRCL